MIGVPGGVVPATGPGPGPFLAGQSLRMRWNVVHNAPAHFEGRVKLRYFATTFNSNVTAQGDNLVLAAQVNGHVEPGSPLYTKWRPTVVDEARKFAEVENIYAVEVELYDASAAVSPLGWIPDPEGPNQVDIVLSARADTLARTNATTGASRYLDRAFAVWDVQIVYEDELGGVVAFQELDPEDAVGVFTTAAGVESPCEAPQVCGTNGELRIDHLLDGVTIAQDITALWPDPADFDHVPLDQAWDRFVEHACGTMHETGPEGESVRCLVDERAWVSDAAQYADYLDIDESFSRLGSGVNRGDGASLTYLTLEVEDMHEGVGRFSERLPIDPTYPYVALLPMLTRNIIGEGILWHVDTHNNPSCDGEWVVEWRIAGCPDRWTYGPIGERWIAATEEWQNALEPTEDTPFYDGFPLGVDGNTWACASDIGASTGSFTIDLLAIHGGQFRFGWALKDDTIVDPDGAFNYRRIDAGDSNYFPPLYVELRLTSPDPIACNVGGIGGGPSVVQDAVVHAHLDEYYRRITCVMQGGDPAMCP